jgi:high affinity Mn2+ porin
LFRDAIRADDQIPDGVYFAHAAGACNGPGAAMGNWVRAFFNASRRVACFAFAAAVMAALPVSADESSSVDEDYAIHGQIVFVDQYHPAFHSPYRGTNSLDPGSRGDETVAATLSAGLRLWDGGGLYVDPEIDQGFGLSNTFGIAAFTSGEAFRLGATDPYFRLQQVFFRQQIDLGGDSNPVPSGFNQLGTSQTEDNLVITAGKFDVTQVFDTNTYAHDPGSDFMNWAVIDAGTFDYAADVWGYTYGSSVEWNENWWTLRSGIFALSRTPNNRDLQTDFAQFQLDDEVEARLDLFGREGKFKLLTFLNRARMGSYDDAVDLAEATHTIPNTALVRKYRSRMGFNLNVEQPITDDLGAFLRAGFSNGNTEIYEYTEINQTVSAGLSLKGTVWGRGDDTVGLAGVVDGISSATRRYLAAGGLGILIGDGRLAHYATENVMEAYYSAQATSWLAATFDYQFVVNPAYNADRGPVSVLAVRLKAQF